MPSLLKSLEGSFLCRLQRMGDLSDISETISARQCAIHLTTDDHPDKPTQLNNLVN